MDSPSGCRVINCERGRDIGRKLSTPTPKFKQFLASLELRRPLIGAPPPSLQHRHINPLPHAAPKRLITALNGPGGSLRERILPILGVIRRVSD